MIKGINKQIIEIKCTNDEYFDKVLLFVRADKAGIPQSVLQKGADNLCGRMLPYRRTGGVHAKNTLKLALLLTAVAAFGALAIFLICQIM